ncbi:MAG: DUF952 domain-containing protein [Pseudomonadota bacterium]
MLIYKIFQPDEWAALSAEGATRGATVDLADGYIHFSTSEQVRGTAEKHFATSGDLVLAAVDTSSLGQDLKWEVARGQALFPHLYRELALEEVVWTAPLKRNGAGHIFPDFPEPLEEA